MAAQPIDLVFERCACDLKILRRPIAPVFPHIAAAPARHHQDAHLIGHIEKLILLEFSFLPDGVQSHVLGVAQLIAQPR